MKYEVSCGMVIYTKRDDETYYVIIKSNEGYYGFPKGHMEDGETEVETAKREVFEEVGLTPEIIEGFRTTDEHPIPSKKNVMKRVIYFLGEYSDQKITYQKEELDGAYLMTYKEAIDSFQFENSKRILTEAKEYLESKVL